MLCLYTQIILDYIISDSIAMFIIQFYFNFVPIFRDFVISYRIFIKKKKLHTALFSSDPVRKRPELPSSICHSYTCWWLKSYIASKIKHQLTSIATVAKEVKTSYHIQSPYKWSCFESHYVLLPYQ